MRSKLLALVCCSVLALLISPASAQASNSWGSYHWARTSNPFTLMLGDNVDSNWDSYLTVASSDWTKSAVLNTAIVSGQAGSPKRCRATSGRIEVCNAAYGRTGWLGVASISVTGGTHITQGTVKLNDTYFNTSTYNTPAWRLMVMCQEVGHDFGLDHQDEAFDNPNLNTCMDYTNDPESNQHPNQHDYDQLEAIYAHLDTFTTIGAATSSRQAQVGNDANTWGRQVAGSRSSGHSTYVRDFGDGNLAVTHVTWAL